MKPSSDQPEANRPLRALLHEWKPAAELPPRFGDAVWQRLARAEAASPVSLGAALRQWLDARFRRPAVALAYLSVLLGTGLATGYLHARADVAQTQSEMKARYLQSVNPFHP